MRATAVLALLVLGCSGAGGPATPEGPEVAEGVPPDAPAASVDSIGTATLLEDGTLVLDLRAQTGATIGDAQLTYPPDHPDYAEVKAHLGELTPGVPVPVPPWD